MNKNRTLYEVVKGFESVNKEADKLFGALKDNMGTLTEKAREKVGYYSEVMSDNIRLQKLVAEIAIKKGEKSSLFEQLGEEVFESGFVEPSVKALTLMDSLFECDKVISEKQAEYDALYKMCKEREEARKSENGEDSDGADVVTDNSSASEVAESVESVEESVETESNSDAVVNDEVKE